MFFNVHAKFGERDELPPCPDCGGAGAVFNRWSLTMWTDCQTCLGAGTLAARLCTECGGTGWREYLQGGFRHCTWCGGWGYELGGHLHFVPNPPRSR